VDPNELIEAGLTKNQAEVYLEVIKHPGQSGGKISKILSMDRSFAYNVLSSLIDKGLVSHVTKENVRLFYPADPENLLKAIDEKRDKIGKLVDGLKLIKEQASPEKSVQVYEGKAGLKAYVRDLLEAKSFLTLGGGGKLSIIDALKYEHPHYAKELYNKKISGKLITSSKNKSIMKKIYGNAKVDIKTFDSLESEVSFTIFKDRLAIYSAEEKPFVIIVKDEKIANALGGYFAELWRHAR
jgi:sugar-specific transcriptional regulator TrmB